MKRLVKSYKDFFIQEGARNTNTLGIVLEKWKRYREQLMKMYPSNKFITDKTDYYKLHNVLELIEIQNIFKETEYIIITTIDSKKLKPHSDAKFDNYGDLIVLKLDKETFDKRKNTPNYLETYITYASQRPEYLEDQVIQYTLKDMLTTRLKTKLNT